MNKKKLGTSAVLTTLISTLFAGSLFAAPLQPINHVDWMQSKSYISGSNDGLALDRPITLVEAVAMIARVQDREKEVQQIDPAIKGWAAKALTWAKQQNIVNAEQWKELHRPANAATLQAVANKAGLNLEATGDTVTREQFFTALGNAITTHITIGHTNDTHGHMLEDAQAKEMGYAKLATLMKELRAENPNSMVLDAGDMIQGTIYVNLSKGENATKLANALGYDFMASGNHEYDFGHEQFAKVAKMFKFPVLGANVFDTQGKPLLQPYVTKQIGDQKFAILGLVTADTPIVTHPDNVKGLTFKDPIEVAKEWVPKLRKEADHVIVLCHTGISYDREMAKQVPGIDIIVGGHSHTPVDAPELVNGTYIVQDWEYAKSLGRVDLYYHGKDLVHFSGGLIKYDESTKADPEVAAIVESVKKEADTLLNEKIAIASVDLDGDRSRVRKQETIMGNLVADAMLARTRTMPGFEADVAITNSGGIRTSIMKGDITKRNLYDVLPFSNSLAVVEVKGSDLIAALESGVSEIDAGSGRFPQVAGLSFSFDSNKPTGSRVSDVKVGDKAVEADKTYRVATNDFLIAGGDGYSMFMNKKSLDTGVTLYEVVEQYMKEKKEVTAKIEQRIKQ
ncbi:5'-nucleotidase C-terminal domain-containing protein [Paenibacillus alvei]|uniref:5'-nucleotidase C-terminal domain-containing protein n=1 Tax=Paenibacillus alvei TaxID=44250 RepID=A0ABT4H7A2_PAEAL|nr:5'-nucleotidase C-terminal domain-containing protein [Paenibacillus alvei]EJW15427.1 trifunctional nucleotide phosphoesterase protein YfkN [Paenibacillus alvei DSM 29]MCY9543998.1 5'-nucleotidase C-terminal domain-containing protein [Paenibacillus alvei]MCY9706465.1 5'-nucleotidase C-terminal domain-containing protein [Paenibacillus alvei]MCY9736390.1 5'-nucleotidase C-terminal domain-containing protein [Paenibacillus alvei]MCY9758669.1 5'-nucleotidase C-terminal domain-containing protein [